MSITMENTGMIPYSLSPNDGFQVTIDISDWLGSDTIESVAYSAVDGDGEDASATVLDAEKHTNTTTVIKPYLKGGTTGTIYTVKCLVTTAAGDDKAFYLKYNCEEVAA